MLLPLAAVVLLGVGGYFFVSAQASPAKYRLAAVDRGDVVTQVMASGTVHALSIVPVIAQTPGIVREVDVDYNSEVEAGQVLARLESAGSRTRLRLAQADLAVARSSVDIADGQVRRAQSELANAQASVAGAQADLQHTELDAADAGRDFKRMQNLASTGDAARAQMQHAQTTAAAADAAVAGSRARAQGAESAVSAAQAALDIARAQLANAQATVTAREAAQEDAQQQVDHTVVRAPVAGIVIERNVAVGQPVATGGGSPLLFTISTDLRNLEVYANVDEADIGRVAPRQPASFSFAAFPGRSFTGSVKQIHRSPDVIQGGVTYTVVITAANPTQELLPGMTADVRITVDRRADALRVPNAALRFRPEGGSQGAGAAYAAETGAGPGVWRPGADGKPGRVAVRLGATGGSFTEVTGGGLVAGQKIIIGFLPKEERHRSIGPLRL
jgi:HlyD family secretion protein